MDTFNGHLYIRESEITLNSRFHSTYSDQKQPWDLWTNGQQVFSPQFPVDEDKIQLQRTTTKVVIDTVMQSYKYLDEVKTGKVSKEQQLFWDALPAQEISEALTFWKFRKDWGNEKFLIRFFNDERSDHYRKEVSRLLRASAGLMVIPINNLAGVVAGISDPTLYERVFTEFNASMFIAKDKGGTQLTSKHKAKLIGDRTLHVSKTITDRMEYAESVVNDIRTRQQGTTKEGNIPLWISKDYSYGCAKDESVQMALLKFLNVPEFKPDDIWMTRSNQFMDNANLLREISRVACRLVAVDSIMQSVPDGEKFFVPKSVA